MEATTWREWMIWPWMELSLDSAKSYFWPKDSTLAFMELISISSALARTRSCERGLAPAGPVVKTTMETIEAIAKLIATTADSTPVERGGVSGERTERGLNDIKQGYSVVANGESLKSPEFSQHRNS
jgi:hypothetical protein